MGNLLEEPSDGRSSPQRKVICVTYLFILLSMLIWVAISIIWPYMHDSVRESAASALLAALLLGVVVAFGWKKAISIFRNAKSHAGAAVGMLCMLLLALASVLVCALPMYPAMVYNKQIESLFRQSLLDNESPDIFVGRLFEDIDHSCYIPECRSIEHYSASAFIDDLLEMKVKGKKLHMKFRHDSVVSRTYSFGTWKESRRGDSLVVPARTRTAARLLMMAFTRIRAASDQTHTRALMDEEKALKRKLEEAGLPQLRLDAKFSPDELHYTRLGIVLVLLGRKQKSTLLTEEGCRAFEWVLEMNPSSSTARMNLRAAEAVADIQLDGRQVSIDLTSLLSELDDPAPCTEDFTLPAPFHRRIRMVEAPSPDSRVPTLRRMLILEPDDPLYPYRYMIWQQEEALWPDSSGR